jgi:hypothetical protein
MKKATIQELVIRDTQMSEGLTKNHKKTDKFVVDGHEHAISDLVTLLDGRVQAAQTADVKRREHSAAVAAYRATIAESAPVLRGVQTQLISQLGATSPSLADYGIPPKKTRQPATVEELAVKVAKGRATRQARHTVGPKKRRSIKGKVPADAATEGSAGVLPARLQPGPATNGAPPPK